MIAATYALAGILLAVTGQLFEMGVLTATTQTAMWSVVFFFASAALYIAISQHQNVKLTNHS